MRRYAAAALVACLLVGAVAAVPATAAESGETTATVVDVVDGDTIEVQYANGTNDTVRLIGVDAPESHADVEPAEWEGVPDTDAGRAWLRRWGQNASDYATERLEGRTVTLAGDAELADRGYYGRLLRYVYVDGALFNADLLERGLARLYDNQFERRSGFTDAESRARADGVGVWGFDAGGSGPTAGLVVAELQADAPGDEYDNLAEEIVVLKNVRSTELSLAGWSVRDPANHSYVFGDVTLAPGATVALHTGSGSDAPGHVYWDREAPVWNNGGDRVIVENAVGETVLNASYDADGDARCRSGSLSIPDLQPTDPDCDGRYEDVDGNGETDVFDVAVLLERFGGDGFQTNGWAFDFDGRDGLSIFDVAALLDAV